jgi:PAS domain S-box-containing protein
LVKFFLLAISDAWGRRSRGRSDRGGGRDGNDRRAGTRGQQFGMTGTLAVPGRRLSVVGFALIGLMLFGAAFRSWRTREDVFASYRRETTNLAIALAAQAARSVQAVDLVVRETQRETRAAGFSKPQDFRRALAGDDLHRFLSRHLKNLPQANAIGIVAADGTLINGSSPWPVPPLHLADKAWFARLRDDRGVGLLLTHPVRIPHTGAASFFLARRLIGPHGAFQGTVVAGIEAGYFEHFYQEITLQHGESIGIYGRDGTLIARYPLGNAAIGTRLPPSSPWYARVAQGGGSYRSASGAGSSAQLVSVVPLRDYPLVLTVAIPQATVLAEWYRQSIIVAIGACLLAFAFVVLVAALTARSRSLERHSAELAASAEALRRSEARFRNYALTSSDWFWETDENHLITYVSDGIRAYIGDPALFIGRSRIQIATSADRDLPKWDEHMGVLHRHQPFRNFAYTVRGRNQPDRTVSISGKPLFDPAGNFLGYHGTGRDITEEHRAQHRLEEAKAAAEAANLAKSQFLANVSHELRTPLNAIIGFAEMLELGMAGRLEPAQRENVAIIHASAQHLHRVINDILDLAKVDAGKLDLYEEAGVDPRDIVEGCVAFVAGRAKEAALSLAVRIEEGLPLLVADPLRLKQILLNLLSNAIKFSEPGGAVVAAARRALDGGIIFEVRDSGPGMTESEIRLALEPFRQVDAGLTRRHEGTGLGLPIARSLAELHGGALEIRSTKGGGTTVLIALPAGRVMAAAPAEVPQEVAAAAA